MSRTAVGVGQTVKRGDRLGWVGSTGLSTGPHLHYEVLVNGKPVDPLRYILPDAITD
jgi:murein DD-endopeptidase MepM/ murein hydrolase activator NlpD